VRREALEVSAFVHLAQTLHDADFAVYLYAVVLVGPKIADELDGASLVGEQTPCFDNHTKTTFA